MTPSLVRCGFFYFFCSIYLCLDLFCCLFFDPFFSVLNLFEADSAPAHVPLASSHNKTEEFADENLLVLLLSSLFLLF